MSKVTPLSALYQPAKFAISVGYTDWGLKHLLNTFQVKLILICNNLSLATSFTLSTVTSSPSKNPVTIPSW